MDAQQKCVTNLAATVVSVERGRESASGPNGCGGEERSVGWSGLGGLGFARKSGQQINRLLSGANE